MGRIIAGKNKGRRLGAPKGLETRPTGARVRQTLFDILAPEIRGCRFLDAFAGTGAVGFEALSRGAAHVVLIDTRGPAVQAIRVNAAALGATAEVFRQDARVALPALADRGRQFDVIYLDPPYASDLYAPVLALIAERSLLAPGGVVVTERFHKCSLPETIGCLSRTREVRIGDHTLAFYRLTE